MRTRAQRLMALMSLPCLCMAASLTVTTVAAQDPAPPPASAGVPATEQETTHAELRKLRDDIIAAWAKHDVDALLTHVAPDVVVTWQNGELSRGHAGVRKFYQEVMGDRNPLISDIDSTLNVDELSILYGDDTAIAFGSIHDDITFKRSVARAPFMGSGRMSLDSRWTATVVKMDGQWKIAAYHVSLDAFSNPLLAKAIEVGRGLALLAGACGLVAGAFIAWLILRRRPAQA